MTPVWQRFWLIVILALASLVISWRPSLFSRDLRLKTGLDLQGGTHLVLATDMTQIDRADRADALESVKTIISRRVDLYGVAEPLIQTEVVKDDYRLIVELPGVKDIGSALNLIGQTAQLDFREDVTVEASPSSLVFMSTGLTGKDLKKASVEFAQSGSAAGQPVVNLEFTQEGAAKFSAITQKNVNKPLAIFLDDQLLTAPIVNEPILEGRAIISGNFSPQTASDLAIQLNAGALPVPVKIIKQQNISATLGTDAVSQSLVAGIIGLILVMLFMALTYGLNGLIADAALIIYGLITVALYKLIPVTLTLPGIAGFILSVGMAVDANILIFERFKEELRSGRPKTIALELAFGRAWDSIKDANLATIITCLVLINPFNLNFLNTSGMVRGFAITLFIGVLISLFTGIVVTRTFLRLFLSHSRCVIERKELFEG